MSDVLESVCTSVRCAHERWVCDGCGVPHCRWTLDERGECWRCETARLRAGYVPAEVVVATREVWGGVELETCERGSAEWMKRERAEKRRAA